MTDRPADPAVNIKTGGGLGRKTARCPICGKSAVAEARPFCSRRCADVDLSRWLGGVYRIPVSVPDEEDSDDRRPPETGPEDSAG